MSVKKLAVLAALLCPLSLLAQDPRKSIYEGNKAYSQGQYQKARDQYRNALQLAPENDTAGFNLGNALFRSGEFDQSARTFEQSALSSSDKQRAAANYYNQGVSFTRQKKLDQSIEAYKNALRLNPYDTLARENLQLALKERQRQQQQPQPQKQQQKKEEKPQQQQSKLNKQQVQQLLKALEEQERKLQEKLSKKNPQPMQPDKDW